MDSHLEDCLKNEVPGKYIFPFLWMHGENQHIIQEEIEAIYNSGISEFCVESRPYQKFEEAEWWLDMEFILKEAKKRGMRVWLLDDKHFPTGYANGWIKNHQALRKVSLRLEYIDVAGPGIEYALLANRLKEEEEYIVIVAWKRNAEENSFDSEHIDLTPAYHKGLVYLDIPPGVWRIFFIIRTFDSIESKKDYIDLLSPESCMAMIHAVYEPHYVRFKKYFGNVFAGFFFDEPGFHNDEMTYKSKLGKTGMLLPWNDDLPSLLAEALGMEEEEIKWYLPALWQNMGEITPWIRMTYMDVVSLKAGNNFSKMIGNWCREHGIMSVGHLIEDMNAHMRLGYGSAHYFRGLEGQDMAGMDIVLGQVNPGIPDLSCAAPVIEDCVDPVFFTYTLPKMAASHSHFCEHKNGRAMCEIFGAYGWAEGAPMMKQILDEMLVSGINYFVPHAFSPKYPDYDCPPHFWARGNNPQFPLFGKLMSYMGRCCHLLSDGIHDAPVALFYNAEADWSGGDYMPLEKLILKLVRNQIDFDIIPEDELYRAVCHEGKIRIHQEKYEILLIPFSEFLPVKLLKRIEKLRADGAKIYYVDGIPKSFLSKNKEAIIKSERLIETLYQAGIEKILPGNICDTELRIYHYTRNKTELYVFLNENRNQEWKGQVRVQAEQGIFYDPWKNQLHSARVKNNFLQLHLFPGELKVFLSDCPEKITMQIYEGPCVKWDLVKPLILKYQISIWEDGKFHLYRVDSSLINLGRPEYLPEYSGRIQYEAVFDLEDNWGWRWLNLGQVGETAELWLNGIYCGACISIPYCFFIGDILKKGENKLRIEVINNLAYKERDEFSKYFPLPPSGILGPVELCMISEKIGNQK